MAFAQEFNYLNSRHLNTPLQSWAVAGSGRCFAERGGVRHAHKRARGMAEAMPDVESVPDSGEIIKLTLRLKPKRRKLRS